MIDGVSQAIGLTNITTRHIRAEEIKNKQFDFAVSRAVAPVKDLWRWSYPLIKKGNKQELPNGLICLKGGDLAQEISESVVKPRMIPIDQIFEEDFFKEKCVLHIAK